MDLGLLQVGPHSPTCFSHGLMEPFFCFSLYNMPRAELVEEHALGPCSGPVFAALCGCATVLHSVYVLQLGLEDQATLGRSSLCLLSCC